MSASAIVHACVLLSPHWNGAFLALAFLFPPVTFALNYRRHSRQQPESVASAMHIWSDSRRFDVSRRSDDPFACFSRR